LIRLRQRLEKFIADRVFIDVSTLKVPALYIISYGPHDPHKNRFLKKPRLFQMAISQEMA
jgi:hypothetical protein